MLKLSNRKVHSCKSYRYHIETWYWFLNKKLLTIRYANLLLRMYLGRYLFRKTSFTKSEVCSWVTNLIKSAAFCGPVLRERMRFSILLAWLYTCFLLRGMSDTDVTSETPPEFCCTFVITCFAGFSLAYCFIIVRTLGFVRKKASLWCFTFPWAFLENSFSGSSVTLYCITAYRPSSSLRWSCTLVIIRQNSSEEACQL